MFKVPTAVQMRVTLQEIEPQIWRRLIVPRTFHLGELHQVIQAAFGWWDYHLHEFQIGGLSFSDPDLVKPEFEGDPLVYDEREVQLLDFSEAKISTSFTPTTSATTGITLSSSSSFPS